MIVEIGLLLASMVNPIETNKKNDTERGRNWNLFRKKTDLILEWDEEWSLYDFTLGPE